MAMLEVVGNQLEDVNQDGTKLTRFPLVVLQVASFQFGQRTGLGCQRNLQSYFPAYSTWRVIWVGSVDVGLE